MMELKWGHLCSDALFDGFGASIANLISGFVAEPGEPPPEPNFPVHMVVRVLASSEAELSQELYVFLTDTNDQPASDPFRGELSFTPLGPGEPLLGGGKFRVNAKALPSVGAYSFDFFFGDATVMGRLPFTIYSKKGKSPAPKFHNPAPVRLEWAHLMLSVRQTLPGIADLIGVFEFIPLPEGEKAINLKDSLVLLQIEADPTIHIHRQLRMVLLDRNDQPAKDERGRLVSPFARPITLRRPPAGAGILVSMAPVRFKNDLWLAPGEYRFRFQLDGNALGAPLDITVLPPV